MPQPLVGLSIVSHNQAALVHGLLDDLQECCSNRIQVVLTLNVPEKVPFTTEKYDFPLRIIKNDTPQGFGANHNKAFLVASGDFFCVLNPDIHITNNPFDQLIASFDDTTGAVAPLVFGPDGEIEDSARRFPTPFQILKKVFLKRKTTDYAIGSQRLSPDWIAGMFLLFPRSIFKKLGGFDEKYFMYYEDVDLCTRLRLSGYKVVLCPAASVTHEARRESHRNLRYLTWHLSSMLRFFFSRVFWSFCLHRSIVSEDDQ